MSDSKITRRDFARDSAVLAGGLVSGVASAAPADRRSILNYNPKMEYRRLGKTNLMVSAVCLGGHWKRVAVMLGSSFGKAAGYTEEDNQHINDPRFLKNRDEVVSRCIESGINYVDACSPQEILAYAKVLKGRRNKMYFGYSWHTREPRYEEWRTAKKLVQGLEDGMKQAGLDYIDLWRISLPMEGIRDLGELTRVEEATIEGLELAKKQGKTRFCGVSSHNRVWLRSVIAQYNKTIDVVLFPYTAHSKELPDDSVFDAIKEYNIGVFGIKPFADNSLFTGNSAPASPSAPEDDRKARLAIRYILGNPAITAPIPGLVNIHQVDNVTAAVQERRKLDAKEKAELERYGTEMWARLPENYNWLRDWQYV